MRGSSFEFIQGKTMRIELNCAECGDSSFTIFQGIAAPSASGQ